MSQIDVILIIAMVVILVLAIFVILPWRMRRAMRIIIRTFVEHNATSAKNAIAMDELKIKSQSIFSLRLKLKDFKKEALDVLLSTGAVQMTGDNRLYLLEEKIMDTKLLRPKSYYR